MQSPSKDRRKDVIFYERIVEKARNSLKDCKKKYNFCQRITKKTQFLLKECGKKLDFYRGISVEDHAISSKDYKKDAIFIKGL